ncbi:MAG: 50S ribosomal protein L25/general stress protein Ctc, partial [Phycisphaerales bacterium]|nr:50S ribosomal protein L25/general stress protein Ctc [Phycisphaerales bacterium]
MQKFEIIADQRVDQGKGASRRLRRAGLVPGILYGAGKEPVAVQVPHKDLARQLENEAFYSHILELRIGADVEKVVLKDLQRHPVKPLVMHVDLLRVAADQVITMRVPVHFVNEDQCAAVKTGGGLMQHQMNEIEVVCLPGNLPEFIAVDVSALGIGDSLHIGDLVMPAGVQIAALLHGGDPNQPVVSVLAPQVASETAEGEGEGEGA